MIQTLSELLTVLHFARPPMLFPNCLFWTSRTETMHSPSFNWAYLSTLRRLCYLFTSYDNFIQTTGIRDDVSYCAKILTCFYDNLDISDPTDPEVTIQIDVSNSFNSTNRGLTLDVLNGRSSRDYASDLKKGDVIPTVDTLSNLFAYFKTM